MIAKDFAQNVINTLPEESTMDDIIHALYVQMKFEKGRDEIKQGKGIPHDEAKKRLQKWVK